MEEQRQKMTKAQAGSLGGKATVAKYGREYMREIGKRGYKVTVSKYVKLPANLSQWVMVRKSDNKVIAVW